MKCECNDSSSVLIVYNLVYKITMTPTIFQTLSESPSLKPRLTVGVKGHISSGSASALLSGDELPLELLFGLSADFLLGVQKPSEELSSPEDTFSFFLAGVVGPSVSLSTC